MKGRIEYRHHGDTPTQHRLGSSNPRQASGIVERRQFGECVNPFLNLFSDQRRPHVPISSMYHTMADRLDLSARIGQIIKEDAQGLRMISDFEFLSCVTNVLSSNLEACGAPDTFHRAVQEWRSSCEFSLVPLNDFNEPKFDRRTAAIDHQNQHVNAEASPHAS